MNLSLDLLLVVAAGIGVVSCAPVPAPSQLTQPGFTTHCWTFTTAVQTISAAGFLSYTGPKGLKVAVIRESVGTAAGADFLKSMRVHLDQPRVYVAGHS